MTTLVKTNEFGKTTKSFYSNEQKATDASNSFLRDCTVNVLDREKRSVEIVDFDFKKYNFDSMPIFAQYEVNNLGLFVVAVFKGLSNQNIRITNQVTEL